MTHWRLPDNQQADEVFTFDRIQEDGIHGFVYIITNKTNGMMYIGRKRMTRRLTRPPLKGRKNRRHYVKESDWKKYTGSSKLLNAEIERIGIENFTFQIVSLHHNQTEMNYHEMALQFLHNVLQAKFEDGSDMYYNDNIAQQFYASEKFHDERMALYEDR